MLILILKICVSLSAENIVSKLKWGKKLKNFPRIATVFGTNQTC